MKIKPILFSSEMVQAILSGRKAMTRRLVKPQPVINEFGNVDFSFKKHAGINAEIPSLNEPFVGILEHCPYSQGDILWVRETLCQEGELGLKYDVDNEWLPEDIIPEIPFKNGPYGGDYWFRKIPNIHMPKWACRIFLKVKSVSVARLQDITEADAMIEGVHGGDSAIDAFGQLWKRTYGEESWQANPFVWVVYFYRCERPENF